MKNFVANCETINITAAAVIASGQGVLVGSIFGVAVGAAAICETAVIRLVGVFSRRKRRRRPGQSARRSTGTRRPAGRPTS